MTTFFSQDTWGVDVGTLQVRAHWRRQLERPRFVQDKWISLLFIGPFEVSWVRYRFRATARSYEPANIFVDGAKIERRVITTLGQDPHTVMAAALYNVPQDAVTPGQRTVGKSRNFAMIYGGRRRRYYY